MPTLTTLKKLCTPSFVYFVMATLGLFVTIFQNLKNNGLYILGNLSIRVPSTLLIFICKALYIVFWTWVLNLICKDGQSGIAWFLVLLPFIMFFSILLIVSNQQKKNKKYF